MMGTIAPTLSTAVLGGSLANGPSSKLGWRVLIGIVLGKLVFVPLGMLLVLRSARDYIPHDYALLLVMMVESITPSANNTVMMCTLIGFGVEEMSAVLFWEYLIGVFPMGFWIVCYLSFIAW